MASSNNNGPEDEYVKKVWKCLSKENTMDSMRNALQNDEGFQKYQEEIKKKLQNIINGSDDSKSYEKIFCELAGLDQSQACDQDLENSIKQAVDHNKSLLPEDTKKNIFKVWDKIIEENHKSSK